MIQLRNKANVLAPTTAYPYGSILDDTGAGNDGTPVDRQVYSDTHQFQERIMALSGLVPNNLPDNQQNGFQLAEALLRLIAQGSPFDAAGVWTSVGVSAANVYVNPALSPGSIGLANSTTKVNRIKLFGRTVLWQVLITNLTISGSPSLISFELPYAGWRFLNTDMQIPAVYNGLNNIQAVTGIDTSGAVANSARCVHLGKVAGGNFTNGTNNQSLAFSIMAELNPA